MRTTLNREQYDAEIRQSLLAAFPDREKALEVFGQQYPKPAVHAEWELRWRGVEPGGDLPDRDFSAEEIDGMVVALEAAGCLTREARSALTAGMSLAEFRRRFGDADLSPPVRRGAACPLVLTAIPEITT